MAKKKAPLRPLPPDARWGKSLWAFNHDAVTCFASRLSDGWAVVRQDAEDDFLAHGHASKASAKRAAMDEIDRRHAGQGGAR